MTDDDRAEIRRQAVVAILGIVIGAFTTFFTKFIETEYLFQRNLKVIEYRDQCKPMPSSSSDSTYHVQCFMSLAARGIKPIKGVNLSVTVLPASGAPPNSDLPILTVQSPTTSPSFAPPDPLPAVGRKSSDPEFADLSVERFREPQSVSWIVDVSSRHPINPDTQIERIVSTKDDDAHIERGVAWRWKRWISLGSIALILPAIIAALILIVMWILRSRAGGRDSDVEDWTP